MRAKTEDLLVERMRPALFLISASLLLFLLQDLFFFRPLTALLLLIKACQLTLAAVSLWLIHTGRVPRNKVAFALCLAAAFGFFATAASIVRGSASGTALLFIVVTAATATAFPWGARAQTACVGICALLLTWKHYVIEGTLVPSGADPAAAAMLTAGLVSIFVARSVEQFRFQIEEREMGLRLREKHFRSLIEHGGDLIVVVGEEGGIRYVSPSATNLLGHSVEAWVGNRLLDFVHPDDVAALREAMAASNPGASHAQRIELRLRHASGAWRDLDGSIADLRTDAAVKAFVLNARDVTERRRMEIDLRQKQAELTHALRLGTIGEIASALAHEINQPLAAIANYASACGRRIDAGTGSWGELRRAMQLIADEALRAGHIVHGLRDLSRKGHVGMQTIDVNAVVGRAVELMEPQASLQGIAVRLQAGAGLPGVLADAIQLQQVLLNLLLNAIESMQASPVRTLSVSTVRRDARVEVCVRDTGVGLGPDLVDRVFEPYFTTKPTGLGMGLAISRRIVVAHGGAFRAAANPDGPGSAFTFWLPVAAEDRIDERESAAAGGRS